MMKGFGAGLVCLERVFRVAPGQREDIGGEVLPVDSHMTLDLTEIKFLTSFD